MVIHVEGPGRSAETASCLVRLTAGIVGGGTAVACLVRLTGTIAFHLPHRLPRYRILIVDRFAADGTFVEDPPGNVRASNLLYRVP